MHSQFGSKLKHACEPLIRHKNDPMIPLDKCQVEARACLYGKSSGRGRGGREVATDRPGRPSASSCSQNLRTERQWRPDSYGLRHVKPSAFFLGYPIPQQPSKNACDVV